MPLQDAQAPVKRDFHAEAIKRVQIEMQNDLDGWNFYMLDEKAKKLQADFSKFEARIVEIACDKGADESTKKENDDVHKEIEKIFFAVKSVLRKRMAQANIVSSDENTSQQANANSNAAVNANTNASMQQAFGFSLPPCFLCKRKVFRFKVTSEQYLCIKCFKTKHIGRCSEPKCNQKCPRCSTPTDFVFHNSTLCERNE